ncbi:MAG: prolyl aminopeptidase [Halobacteriovoraceae bacterium]|nr:prolyl aminopeptidase [Halobacteriovoraceae bacterium]
MSLYPAIEPYNCEFLKVSDIHTVYFEECGNPLGVPVVFLHGGPGGGIQVDYRQYFNPNKYRVILFDQRGCGKSTPFAELRENTTWDLVEDIEKIRKYLKIDKWAVFGGSWGSTLSLTYAITYPDKCLALFLRGIFLLRKKEIDWFYQEGASRIFPDAWEKYLGPIPIDKRNQLLEAYHEILTGNDEDLKLTAAKAWSVWEGSTSKLIPSSKLIEQNGADDFAIAFARIECHYFKNKGFFEDENFIFQNLDKIRHIPAVIVQGRYDVVCPAETAWELHRQWPEAQFVMIDDAGHSLSEKGIQVAMVKATDEFF